MSDHTGSGDGPCIFSRAIPVILARTGRISIEELAHATGMQNHSARFCLDAWRGFVWAWPEHGFNGPARRTAPNRYGRAALLLRRNDAASAEILYRAKIGLNEQAAHYCKRAYHVYLDAVQAAAA